MRVNTNFSIPMLSSDLIRKALQRHELKLIAPLESRIKTLEARLEAMTVPAKEAPLPGEGLGVRPKRIHESEASERVSPIPTQPATMSTPLDRVAELRITLAAIEARQRETPPGPAVRRNADEWQTIYLELVALERSLNIPDYDDRLMDEPLTDEEKKWIENYEKEEDEDYEAEEEGDCPCPKTDSSHPPPTDSDSLQIQ